MVAPTLADLRYAFFGGGPGKTVSDAEYIQLKAMYDSGINLAQLAAASSPPPVGEMGSLPRSEINSIASPTVNQELVLTYFVATRTMVAGRLVMYSGGTAAGATPSLVRFGIYEVNTDNTLTLVASIANSTSIFAAANTEYVRNLTANLNMVAGKMYATGCLVVSAAAMPTVVGKPAIGGALSGVMKLSPSVSNIAVSQADLPANLSFGSVAGSDGKRQYMRILAPV